MFIPPLQISLDNGRAARAIGDSSFLPPRLYSNGTVILTYADAATLECAMDMRKFPRDAHMCRMALSLSSAGGDVTWAAAGAHAATWAGGQGEVGWELLDLGWATPVGGDMAATFTLRRRPITYVMSELIPLVSLSLLNPFVFWLPVDSGDRVGFCVTLLLANTIIFSALGSVIPNSTDVAVLVGAIAIVNLEISTCATLIVVVEQRMLSWEGNVKKNHYKMWRMVSMMVPWRKKARAILKPKTEVGVTPVLPVKGGKEDQLEQPRTDEEEGLSWVEAIHLIDGAAFVMKMSINIFLIILFMSMIFS